MLLINLGCGTSPAEGWVNLDRSPGLELRRLPSSVRASLSRFGVSQSTIDWPESVQRVDVTRGLPFRVASVDAIYSSHMLEHLSLQDAGLVLDECRRVLKPGGVLRLALPDLRSLAAAYLASDEPHAADDFIQSTLLGWSDTPKGLRRVVELASGARHRWMYDASSIQARCLEHGFASTAQFGFREGTCPDLENVERRRESFFVEANA